MLYSRILAVVIVVAAAIWIGSGVFGRAETVDETPAAAAPAKAAPFQVAVIMAHAEMHARTIVLNGRTESDDRASALARTSGTLIDVRVHRGDTVQKGDVVAVLSDEAREAQVAQAQARLEQRRTELNARLRLIEKGVSPAIEKTQTEAELRSAEADLAQAKAEQERGQVIAPLTGTVSEVPVSPGQALQLGGVVAQIVSLDPMLAVVEVSELRLGGIHVGDEAGIRLVGGAATKGKVRFISPSASATTRTYRVDVEIDNKDHAISDGVTVEVSLKLAPAQAVEVPRSALTFTAEGALAVRVVREGDKVATVPVRVVEDASQTVWLAGVPDGETVIVQGQDFVEDGNTVTPVPVPATAAAGA